MRFLVARKWLTKQNPTENYKFYAKRKLKLTAVSWNPHHRCECQTQANA